MLQGYRGYTRVAARCPGSPPILSPSTPTRVGYIPLHLEVASEKEGGDAEVSLALQCGLQTALTRDPWPDLPF